MNTLIILLIAIVIIVIVTLSLKGKKGDSSEKKIMDFLHKNGRVTNEDVQNMLEVSEPIADEHLQKLEDKKHIVQNEKAGFVKSYQARRM